jgi:hypothetical protein
MKPVAATLIAVLAVGVLLTIAYYSPRHPGKSLGADLSFWFRCEGGKQPPSDGAIEVFLRSKGFRVLNKVSLAKAQHVDYPIFTMDIVALDGKRREITFQGFPEQPGDYNVALFSPPPTQHDTALEQELLDFVGTQLQCKTRQLGHSENGKDTLEFYNELFSLAEGWFKEADEMQHSAK